MDRIRNEYIRGTAQVGRFGDKARQAKLRYFEHVHRRYASYNRRKILKMELPGKRKRGGPERFMGTLREAMHVVGATDKDAGDRKRWKQMIHCGDP